MRARCRRPVVQLLLLLCGGSSVCGQCPSSSASVADSLFNSRVVVTDEAQGARCAVAADLDGDGKNDLISASSTDNTVAWYRNLGNGGWSAKLDITYSSNGARIVTTGDVDGDGDIDAIAASYYDNTIRWFENDGTGVFTAHVITTSARHGQGVFAADLDGDGDLDLASASSGDNAVAVYINVANGTFCEVKRIVDDHAMGVRTVVAADLDGDGDLDLVSASKDDDTVAWYANDGSASFGPKIIISSTARGAYSLVAHDIEGDGDMDLIVASNGDDTVALYRNDGTGTFTRTVIYDEADFVLSVTAFDFDRDGDVDVASASYLDGYVRWYENLDGSGSAWLNHTLWVGSQGHYVSTADMDGDGDEDLVAVTKSENRVQIFYAATRCDGNQMALCCHWGQSWNGTSCVDCAPGTYGDPTAEVATCIPCPSSCMIRGLTVLPHTCSGITGCADASADVQACDCPANTYKSNTTDVCVPCPAGQTKTSRAPRTLSSLGKTTLWAGLLNTCAVDSQGDTAVSLGVWGMLVAVILIGVLLGLWSVIVHARQKTREQCADESGTIDMLQVDGAISGAHLQLRMRSLLLGIFVLAAYLTLSVVVFHQIEPEWSWVDAIYFSMATCSTVGFGDLSPTTRGSRAFTVTMILLGISLVFPIAGAALSDVIFGPITAAGRRLLDVAFPSPKFVDHGDGDVTRKPRPASLYYLINLTPSLVLTLVLQLLSAQVFVVIEGVDYSTALYLCVVTATTVGYGDVPIPTDGGRLFAASIMLLDVVLLAELFSTLRTIIAARSELAKQYRQEQALQNKTLLKRLLWCAHRLRSVDEKSSSTSHRQHAQPAAQQSTKREQDEFYKDLTEDSSAFGISESEFAMAMLIETGAVESQKVKFFLRMFRQLDWDGNGELNLRDLETDKPISYPSSSTSSTTAPHQRFKLRRVVSSADWDGNAVCHDDANRSRA